MLWQLVAAFCAIGWMISLVFLWRNKHQPVATDSREKESIDSRAAYKQLIAACASDQAAQARAALISWGGAVTGEKKLSTLAAVADVFEDESLSQEIDSLERSLYSGAPSQWHGASLASQVQRLHKQKRETQADDSESLALYPTG